MEKEMAQALARLALAGLQSKPLYGDDENDVIGHAFPSEERVAELIAEGHPIWVAVNMAFAEAEEEELS